MRRLPHFCALSGANEDKRAKRSNEEIHIFNSKCLQDTVVKILIPMCLLFHTERAFYGAIRMLNYTSAEQLRHNREREQKKWLYNFKVDIVRTQESQRKSAFAHTSSVINLLHVTNM